MVRGSARLDGVDIIGTKRPLLSLLEREWEMESA